MAIDVKEAHVNVPKHNLNRLAPTWAEQKQMLIDVVSNLSHIAPKGTNPQGDFYEVTVQINNTSGNPVTIVIRWFEYLNSDKVITTAFVL